MAVIAPRPVVCLCLVVLLFYFFCESVENGMRIIYLMYLGLPYIYVFPSRPSQWAKWAGSHGTFPRTKSFY